LRENVPQIEVAFDLDANGVLNVHAEDKACGKSSKIVITNDKGRLSKDDIERMVQEAEKYKEEDRRTRERIDARNGLENYAYSVKNSTQEEKLKDKISPEDHAIIETSCKEAIDWLESNPNAEKEEYDEQQKKLEGKINPIMMKAYGGGGAPGAGMPEGFSGSSGNTPGPNVEEVD
jgi:L1 cell adhesion molecule like protein